MALHYEWPFPNVDSWLMSYQIEHLNVLGYLKCKFHTSNSGWYQVLHFLLVNDTIVNFFGLMLMFSLLHRLQIALIIC